MRITFKVETVDGTKTEVQTSYGDLIALETKFSINASDLGTTQRALWLAHMAYTALKRRGDLPKSPDGGGVLPMTFEQWTDTLVNLEPLSEDGSGNR